MQAFPVALKTFVAEENVVIGVRDSLEPNLLKKSAFPFFPLKNLFSLSQLLDHHFLSHKKGVLAPINNNVGPNV
jgi:hypothetical protein